MTSGRRHWVDDDLSTGDPMATDALSSKQPTAQVTVLIADDAATVRRALGQLLAADPRFALVAVAGDGDEAAALAADCRPQLAVLDVRMGGGGGPSAAERIRTASPDTVVVALSALDTPSSRRRMAAAGAKAYLVKGATDDLLDRLWGLATHGLRPGPAHPGSQNLTVVPWPVSESMSKRPPSATVRSRMVRIPW